MPFQPGQSGNPKGRPKLPAGRHVADVRAMANAWTREAIDTLATIMTDPKESSKCRILAAVALLDRAHGRPHQHTTSTGTGTVIHLGFLSAGQAQSHTRSDNPSAPSHEPPILDLPSREVEPPLLELPAPRPTHAPRSPDAD